MNFNKKIFIFAVFVLYLNLLFADKQIGLVPSSVKNERDILQVRVLEGDIPVLVVKEEREGFVSTITEYFVIYGKERVGPFDDVGYISSHQMGKLLCIKLQLMENGIFLLAKKS